MRALILWSAALVLPLAMASAEDAIYEIHGKAWMDMGRVMHVTDTVVNALDPETILNLNGNGIQSLGGQFTVTADLADNLEGAFGFGAYKATHAIGSGQWSFMTISMFQNFLTQSRLTWYQGEKAAPTYSVTVGSFPYSYNPDVKNLGLYLLRGPVYPGILMGGFGDFHADSTKATMLGLHAHHAMGNFSHDVILNSEREIPPTFDWSLAYLAHYQAGPLQLGTGVNFYRLIPYNSGLESPAKDTLLVGPKTGTKWRHYVDISGTDTTYLTSQGTKLMANFSMDFKTLFGGQESLSPDDLKLYGEVAVIGVKNYGKAYDDIKKRMPVMFGFNLPTFKYLDHISMEVEYYGATYRNDLALIGNNNAVADWTIIGHAIPSPKPPSNADYGIDSAGYFHLGTDSTYVRGTGMDKENLTMDNLKWSLYLDKTISKHIQFIGQVANDHYRPRPVATGLIKSDGGTAEAFTTSKDWYFMVRMGYFF